MNATFAMSLIRRVMVHESCAESPARPPAIPRGRVDDADRAPMIAKARINALATCPRRVIELHLLPCSLPPPICRCRNFSRTVP